MRELNSRECRTEIIRVGMKRRNMMCFKCSAFHDEHILFRYDDLCREPNEGTRNISEGKMCIKCFIELVEIIKMGGELQKSSLKKEYLKEPFTISNKYGMVMNIF